MTHRPHPIEGDPKRGAFLYDDCPRCDHQAVNPWELDDLTLRGLVRLRSIDQLGPSTENEAIAIERLRLWGRVLIKAGLGSRELERFAR